jgi:hypothetical protein
VNGRISVSWAWLLLACALAVLAAIWPTPHSNAAMSAPRVSRQNTDAVVSVIHSPLMH